MKKIIYILLLGASSLIAENSLQPLYLSNITFKPEGCGTATTPATLVISATGAGGAPDAQGYTFTLTDIDTNAPITLTGKTVTFQSQPVTNDTQYTLEVKDAQDNKVEYTVTVDPSSSKLVSFTINSLPLGEGPGCITLSVTDPAGTPTGSVDFAIVSAEAILQRQYQTIRQAPFSQTFSAFTQTAQSNPYLAITEIALDCNNPNPSIFVINFPLPQGQGNSLQTYIYNKYCSCTLRAGTVPATV